MSLQNLADSIQFNMLYAFLLAFFAGTLTSLGPCTFVRGALLLSYTGTEENLTKKRGLFLSFMFLVGLTLAYSLLGLAGFIAARIFQIGTGLYYFVGIVAILMGLHFAGIIQIRLPTSSSKLSNFRRMYTKYRGVTGTLLMGTIFGLMLCPCCIPGLLTIFAFTFAKGKLIYGILLIFTYTIGHGIPLLFIGVFSSAMRTFRRIQVWGEHINLVNGTLMIVIGFLFLWIV